MTLSGPCLVVVGMASETRGLRRGPGRTPLIVIGVGGLDAAMALGPAAVVSFGLCGALDPALALGQLVIGTTVIGDPQLGDARSWPTDQALSDRLALQWPNARRDAVAGTDEIVGDALAKAELRTRTGAGIVDMESRQAGAAAAKAGLPFAILRAVSDGATQTLPFAAQAGFRPDGTVDVLAVVMALLARPGELPPLIRTAIHAGTGLRTLARAAAVLRTLD